METTFLFIFTFLFLQVFGGSSETMMMNSSSVTCTKREQQSLLTFKQSLTDRYNRLSTWTGLECCEWLGVECDRRNGHVVKLDLRTPVSFAGGRINTENWLGGEVSPLLLNLKHLRHLDLSVNNFSGQIPQFLGSFKHLEYLNLSCSGFVGVVPSHLGNLSRLQYLDLNNYLVDDEGFPIYYSVYSLLTKDDLGWVSSLSSLKHLDLSGIKIGKNIDWFHPVNMLPSLLTLNLAYSHINIPSVTSTNFTSLISLDISVNFINSTIPVWLSNLTGLTRLDLSSNMFHGSVSPDVKLCNLSVLNLSDNRFVGDLSSFMDNMPDCLQNSLKVLNLKGNQFKGSIPNKIGDFNKLEHLLLLGNTLSGSIPPSLGGLSSLRVMDASINRLNGSMPTSFGLLSMLEKLNLQYNRLSGNIPASFGLLSKLEELLLDGNQLSGNIPMSLGKLSKLKTLDVSSNLLVGVLSESHFIKLKNLNILMLSSNSLALNVSSQWIPPFQLQEFGIGSGNIGPHFPNWLQTQKNLERLDLYNTSVSDTIPDWFESISSNITDLDLSYNQISGKLPRFHGSALGRILVMNSNKFEGSLTSFPSNVDILDLSDNLLSGNLPRIDGTMNLSLKTVKLSKNRFTGGVPVQLCKVFGIQALELSQNKLSGRFPWCLGNLLSLQVIDLSENRFTGRIPVNLCNLPSISVLNLAQNKFSGRLPGCLGNLNNMRVIDVTNNSMIGSVPSSLGNLKDLRSLHLDNNRFHGDLPISLHNLTELVIMDLGNNLFTGSIPSWIGENLRNLRILNLQFNKFTGKIPLQLCQLSALQHLNLAQNNITGMIPRCFGNLSGMIITDQDDYKYTWGYEESILASTKGNQLLFTNTIRFLTSLDLSSNHLNGEIPDALMDLVGLKNLNLSGNMLKGQIPVTIGHLKQMESLDLAMNKLSGRIPQSLTSLNFLSYLNLSFNNLSGSIPTGNQLQTLADPSNYKGNNELCGPPVSRSCKGNDSLYNQIGEDEGQDDTHDFWFYSGLGSGFVVGFLRLLGSLHFIRSWRVTYVTILEKVYGWLMVSILLNVARTRRKFF